MPNSISKPSVFGIRQKTKRPLLKSATLVGGLLVLLWSQTAQAAVITVTTVSDDLTPNDGSLSLREAITAINAGNDLGDPDITAQNPGTFGTNDTINFNISGSSPHVITLGSALPTISQNLTVNGGGALTTIVDANHVDGVFDISGS